MRVMAFTNHPSQALLDAFYHPETQKSFKGLQVSIMGDI